MDQGFEEFEVVDFKKIKDKPKKKVEKEKVKKQEEQKQINERNEKRYKQLLKRIIETLNKNNLDLGETNKILLKPPEVVRVGTKKTAIKNFNVLCKQLDRNPEHVMNFFLEDLGGTTGSFGSMGLVIKNVLTSKNVENLLRKYVIEFVQCQLCRRQNTELIKDEKARIWNIHCKSCQSTRSVRTIKGAQKKVEEVEGETGNEEKKRKKVEVAESESTEVVSEQIDNEQNDA